jgi:hypothetical protein
VTEYVESQPSLETGSLGAHSRVQGYQEPTASNTRLEDARWGHSWYDVVEVDGTTVPRLACELKMPNGRGAVKAVASRGRPPRSLRRGPQHSGEPPVCNMH